MTRTSVYIRRMVFKPRPAPSPGTDEIVPLDSRPEYAPRATLRRALMAARDDRQAQIDLADLDAALLRMTNGSRADAIRERAERLREQIAATSTPDTTAAPSPGATVSPAITAAVALLRGGVVDLLPDRAERLRRLDREVAILDAAIREIDIELEGIRSELSLEVARKLVPQHKAILRTIYETAVALTAAVAAERSLFAVPLIANYEGRPDILNRPALDGASRLGTLAEWDSQISTFRRRLELLKVI